MCIRPIAALVLVLEHAAVVVVPADVVDDTMIVDTIGGIVVPSEAADKPADTDHDLVQGPQFYAYHVLPAWA